MTRLQVELNFSYIPHTPLEPRPMLATPRRTAKKPRVLILGRLLAEQPFKDKLESLAEVHHLLPVSPEKVNQTIKDKIASDGPFDAVATVFSNDPFPWKIGPEQFAPFAPHTKLYVNPGAGYDKIDVEWITSTGAWFANCPQQVGIRTADATLSLILTIARGLTTQFLSARAGNWRDASVRPLNWRKSTLGIFGLGNIGRQVADSAAALGFNVIYNNRTKVADAPYRWVSKGELLYKSDIVLLLVPLTESTRHLIDKDAFRQAKDGMILVNVGPIVDEQALVEALESGKVMRAALDVFENEPKIHPKLMSNPNVYVTPHVAAFTEDVSIASANEVLENIIRFIETGKPNTPVNDPKTHRRS